MAVTAYQVVRSTDLGDMQARVNAALANGWQPFGGITQDHTGGYCQVMVQEDGA